MKEKFKKDKRVFCMMSGGVDSSVAAFLLKKQNYQVVGCFIKGYNVDGCQEKEAEDARRVAEYLSIPFYTVDLEKEYKKLVVDYTIRTYKDGLTPNPDVMCNKEIKFGLFFKKALELGADYVATGHYVRLRSVEISPNSPIFSLFQARDKNKDQSYFLWTMTQDQLRHCLFPIGDYLKSEVRKIAKSVGLPTAEKKDSQGICFLGQISMEDFLKKYIPIRKGPVLNMVGEKIGEHKGACFYTIGQRHGLGISGKKPYYVVEKDVKKNVIKVVEGKDDYNLYKKEVLLNDVNFINPILQSRINNGADYQRGKRRNEKISVFARVRYRQPLHSATLLKDSHNYKLIFNSSLKFVAPGQSAVLYNNKDEMLGGGIIAI